MATPRLMNRFIRLMASVLRTVYIASMEPLKKLANCFSPVHFPANMLPPSL